MMLTIAAFRQAFAGFIAGLEKRRGSFDALDVFAHKHDSDAPWSQELPTIIENFA